MDEDALLRRITVNLNVFGGKPIVRVAGSPSSMSSACCRR
jgi:hypothetical protein